MKRVKRCAQDYMNLVIWDDKLFTKRLIHYLQAGLYAGLLLAFIEAINRSVILSHHFTSIGNWFLFVCVLAFIPVGNLILGLLAAALCTVGAWTKKATPEFIGSPVMALAMAAPLMLMIALVPAFSNGFHQLLIDINGRILNISPAIAYSTILLCAGLYLLALILAWLDSERFERLCERTAPATSICSMLLFLVIGFYLLDSRVFVGRYQYFFHFPATIGALAASFVFGIVIARRLKNRHALFALLTLAAFALAAVAAYRLDSNNSAKALFWRRGVIAKKYVSLAQYLIDFDRDGFSPFLGGGDCDDHNPERNLLARDIPGNGIDENCLSGDLQSSIKYFSDLNQRPLPEKRAKNILFITVDCLRADHLGCYGYSRNLSPNIDKFASRGVIFENGFSLGTNTGHSFSGIARSSYGEEIFNDNLPTIPELFAANGITTAAITSPRTDKWLWKQGWESYKTIMLKGLQSIVHNEEKYWDSKDLTDRTIKYLQSQQEKPFYAWIHYNDLHAKNEKYVSQDSNEFGDSPLDIYDSNIVYTDKHMGRLIEYLESSGLLESTVIAISADHGEEFLEHGQQFHNGRPYREQTHVPLILWYPGASPMRVSEPVSNIDLGPTFLRCVGLHPPVEYAGVDLIQTIEGNIKGRSIFMETPRNVPQGDFFAWAVVQGEWRLIFDQVGNTYELFNEAEDPAGRHNLIDELPDRADTMRALMGQWLDAQSRHEKYRYWARF
jgi:arylsulfatase A-like enzyme